MIFNERIHFRLFNMACCGHLLCWVNPRFPNYCPECGKYVFRDIKSWVTHSDEQAYLKHKVKE